MRTVYDIRRENIRALSKTWGVHLGEWAWLAMHG